MTICVIEWNELSLPEWDEYFTRIRRSNLLQSYPYAQAVCLFHRQRARWGLIKIDGHGAGLVQVFEAGLFRNALHAVIVDRGPLWLPGYGAPEHLVAFFAALDQTFPKRLGRRRRIIPEIDQSQALLIPFSEVTPVKPYQTIWLDLTKAEAVLRADLDRRWRNHLSKAERAGLRVEWDGKGAALSWLLKHHDAHRTIKNFRAASPKFIRLMAGFFAPRGDMLVGQAFLGNEPVAGVLFFRHGVSATYQVGWSGEEGRKTNAHHLLLWQGALALKAAGVQDLDLGGVNDVAAGVRIFKEGMGGDSVTMAGLYT